VPLLKVFLTVGSAICVLAFRRVLLISVGPEVTGILEASTVTLALGVVSQHLRLGRDMKQWSKPQMVMVPTKRTPQQVFWGRSLEALSVLLIIGGIGFAALAALANFMSFPALVLVLTVDFLVIMALAGVRSSLG